MEEESIASTPRSLQEGVFQVGSSVEDSTGSYGIGESVADSTPGRKPQPQGRDDAGRGGDFDLEESLFESLADDAEGDGGAYADYFDLESLGVVQVVDSPSESTSIDGELSTSLERQAGDLVKRFGSARKGAPGRPVATPPQREQHPALLRRASTASDMSGSVEDMFGSVDDGNDGPAAPQRQPQPALLRRASTVSDMSGSVEDMFGSVGDSKDDGPAASTPQATGAVGTREAPAHENAAAGDHPRQAQAAVSTTAHDTALPAVARNETTLPAVTPVARKQPRGGRPASSAGSRGSRYEPPATPRAFGTDEGIIQRFEIAILAAKRCLQRKFDCSWGLILKCSKISVEYGKARHRRLRARHLEDVALVDVPGEKDLRFSRHALDLIAEEGAALQAGDVFHARCVRRKLLVRISTHDNWIRSELKKRRDQAMVQDMENRQRQGWEGVEQLWDMELDRVRIVLADASRRLDARARRVKNELHGMIRRGGDARAELRASGLLLKAKQFAMRLLQEADDIQQSWEAELKFYEVEVARMHQCHRANSASLEGSTVGRRALPRRKKPASRSRTRRKATPCDACARRVPKKASCFIPTQIRGIDGASKYRTGTFCSWVCARASNAANSPVMHRRARALYILLAEKAAAAAAAAAAANA